ncbi:MAG: D-glycero-beta-D-manno-heptose-7-phosphate kinase [Pseudomonadota bacterium]|nr:D-glycero-beta-D-manno-heptose-7-phosphate kinase [Pseudomonadota bacterium]
MIKRKNILVIGDVMLDKYWSGNVERISPEAPVPVINITSSVNKPGGAANVAMNLAALGMNVTLSGITGNDDANDQISHMLKKYGIDFQVIIDPKIRTTTKLRITGKNQQLMRIDHEDRDKTKLHKKLLDKIIKTIKNYDAIIISDYDKGVVKPIIVDILKYSSKFNVKTFIDPKGDNFDCYKNAFLLKPNQKEFDDIVGLSKTKSDFYNKAEKLRKKLKLTALLVTRGKKGMTLFQKSSATSYKAQEQDVFDVTGAGDTVISVLAASIASGKGLVAAVKLSNVAAGLSVQKLGATSVTQEELSDACKQ